MKGLVLCGGKGTRLRPITFALAKQLVPVANKPVVEYGLEDLVEAGITDIGVIMSRETGPSVESAIRGAADRIGFAPTFILQEAPLGLAHALKTALPFIDGDDVVMHLGDNLVKGGIAGTVADFREHRPNCQILLARVPNPEAFGVAELDDDGSLLRLVEKPAHPASDLALVGIYLFDATIAGAVEAIRPSARGELEITDAIQHLLDTGRSVRWSIVDGWWKDMGTKHDLLAAQHLVIAELADRVEGEMAGTTASGRLHLGSGSRVVDSTIVGPVVIGDGVEIVNSTIGPETSVGDGCTIVDARIEGSIIMEGADVRGWSLRSTVLGRRARLAGAPPPGFVEMMVGDQSEVEGP